MQLLSENEKLSKKDKCRFTLILQKLYRFCIEKEIVGRYSIPEADRQLSRVRFMKLTHHIKKCI